MIAFMLDIEDGRGAIEVVVSDEVRWARLRRFAREAAAQLRDAERWHYIESIMTHERCGPNAGWTIGDLTLQGDTPTDAVDAAIAALTKDDR